MTESVLTEPTKSPPYLEGLSRDPISRHAVLPPLPSLYANDPRISQILGVFIQYLPQRYAAIQDAAVQARWTDCMRLSHQLAGAAGGYGFPDITAVAARIEEEAHRQAPGESLTSLLKELANLCERASASL